MRISEQTKQVIKDSTRSIFGPDAMVKLFGSRVNDELKGGDIDLLVECPEAVVDSGLKATKLAARIQLKLGEQKIDVICLWPGKKLSPVHKSALETGIPL